MARRTKVVTIEADNRDKGKQFLITEMDSESGEWWAFRVLQALISGNSEIDFNMPMAELARQSLAALGKIDPNQARPLLQEMMSCVKVQLPDGKSSRDVLKNDIEEVTTRVQLRAEVLSLHTDFFVVGGA